MALSAWLYACGDNVSLLDAGPVAPGFEPAPHAPLPQVSGHSNTVLSSVQLVTLTYQDDAERADVEQLGDLVVGSPWYTGVGAEYGVLAGSHLAKVRLGAAPAALGRPQIEAQIRDAVMRGLAPAPVSRSDQLLYLLYVPPQVARAADLTGHGYHDAIELGGIQVPIAAVLEDDAGIASTTAAAARLLINSATDPYGVPDDGYYADPPATDPWSLVQGEVADLCSGETPVPLDDDHPAMAMPRVYSNAAASAGGAPCKPVEPDELWNDVSAEPSRLQPVQRGGAFMFHLTGWSTHPMPDWTLRVEADDRSDFSIIDMQPELTSDTINNNQRVTLTVHAPITADIGQVGGVYVLSGPDAHPWTVGIVVQ
jgi:hypothetical protein